MTPICQSVFCATGNLLESTSRNSLLVIFTSWKRYFLRWQLRSPGHLFPTFQGSQNLSVLNPKFSVLGVCRVEVESQVHILSHALPSISRSGHPSGGLWWICCLPIMLQARRRTSRWHHERIRSWIWTIYDGVICILCYNKESGNSNKFQEEKNQSRKSGLETLRRSQKFGQWFRNVESSGTN